MIGVDTVDSLNKICEQDMKGLGKAIDAALLAEVNDDFDTFCEGLDLDPGDRFFILGGFVQRKQESWLEEPELFNKFLEKVLENYNTKRSRKKCYKQT